MKERLVSEHYSEGGHKVISFLAKEEIVSLPVCNLCKWYYKEKRWLPRGELCTHPSNIKKEDSTEVVEGRSYLGPGILKIKKVTKYHQTPAEKNETNRCKDFEKFNYFAERP